MNEQIFEIRDVVYGFIELDEQERDIINQPAFQRLRRIRQLALTEMVYPGATHTRFEHSLGVLQMATNMYDCIVKKSRDKLRELSLNDEGVKRWRKIIRIAALLHDVGHPPFSHAGEDLMPPKNNESGKCYTHEDYSVEIIKKQFKDIIENHPNNRNYGIKAGEVTALLGDKSIKADSCMLLWKSLISGQLDADRADYLLRDSIHSGVSYGIYDRNRLIHCLALYTTETDSPVIAIQDGGWHVAESLVIARYQMFSQVYFHKTRRIYDYHLCQATKEILKKQIGNAGNYPPPQNIDKYLEFDDWTILYGIKSGNGRLHGEIIKNRTHYRLKHETEMIPTPEDEKRINSLIKEQGSEDTYFLDTPYASTKWYKLDKDIEVFDEIHGFLKPLSEYSPIIKSMVAVPQIKRLYIKQA